MAWSDLVGAMDKTILDLFDELSIVFTPTGGSSQTIQGVAKEPPIQLDFAPGFGSSSVYLFVRIVDITPTPVKGDSVVIGSASYLIALVTPDLEGGAILQLRIK